MSRCSRNARAPMKRSPRSTRAVGTPNQASPLKRKTSKLGRKGKEQGTGRPSFLLAAAHDQNECSSMRAVKDNLAAGRAGEKCLPVGG